MFGNNAGQLAVGLEPWPEKCRVVKRGGAGIRGGIVMFDLANADEATTSNQAGVENGGFASCIVPADTGGAYKWGAFAVLDEAVADDAVANAVYSGGTKAMCVKATAGTIAKGAPLTVKAGELTADVVSGDKVVARARVAIVIATNATAVLGDVVFDGIAGFGAA